MFQEKIDFQKYINDTINIPTRVDQRFITYHGIEDNGMIVQNMVYLRKNKVFLYDQIYGSFGFPSFIGNFYDLAD